MDNSIEQANGCRLWTGCLNAYGYGVIFFSGKLVRTHRIAYEIYSGKNPGGLMVCHKCDVRNCIAKDHLFLGTQKDNMADASAKGRIIPTRVRGEKAGRAILTVSQVMEIRRRAHCGPVNKTHLGREFGVNPMTIHAIIKRKSWTHF